MPDIPRTKSGKITEIAVRDIVHGREVKNMEALANPEVLGYLSRHFRTAKLKDHMADAIELTRALLRFNTINPPGNEQPCADYLGGLLEAAGFTIRSYPMGENRTNLVARIGGSAGKKPLCFSGHTDVVPLGAAPWSTAPFGGDIEDGKIYGRGSSDMKAAWRRSWRRRSPSRRICTARRGWCWCSRPTRNAAAAASVIWRKSMAR